MPCVTVTVGPPQEQPDESDPTQPSDPSPPSDGGGGGYQPPREPTTGLGSLNTATILAGAGAIGGAIYLSRKSGD